MKIRILKPYKSLNIADFELPKFCVLTGKNGSGKTHLMQALSSQEFSNIINDDGRQLLSIKYVPFNGLNPSVQTICQFDSFLQDKKQAWHMVQSAISDFSNRPEYQRNNTYFNELYYAKSTSCKKILSRLLHKCGDVERITEKDFNQIYEIFPETPSELFTSQFATIFKLYHSRMEDNEYNEYRNREKGEHNSVLSDNEFCKLYGPKPWILINHMLEKADLPYRVNSPEGDRKDSDFQLVLTDPSRNINIDVNDLSTGEKVLMSLALAIYNTAEGDNKPDVLLLDEPDAPLHPEYSRVLLSAIYDSIVNDANVTVIISTHNPTTVAFAPEHSLYKMDRESGMPIKVSKKEALYILTKDLDNLRVSVDSRRQIFVENQNDVSYYERIIRHLPDFKVNFQFLPPHTRNGCNCVDVKRIVKMLREFGNDSVYGLVDYDNTNKSDEFVYVIGEQRRYAIDNYIFDPIYVFFLLVREGVVKTEEVGIGSYTFIQLGKLNNEQLQIVINFISDELGFNKNQTEKYHTINGRTFIVANEYFKIQGHELESKIMQKWPQLNAIKKGKNDESLLKLYILDYVINEYPEYISSDFIDTFRRIS